ncbi:MAG: amidophosphoribosyltransferase [Dehalococcoidia bacterium]|nr:MAG: amidophosphoribosyltransferase [Dehalococcoidia bacterium]
MRESCGIFGVYAHGAEVARLAFFGIYALQHRGQESSGIATADGKRIRLHADMGLVAQVFNEATLDRLIGYIAIGHNRYSTTGSSRIFNAQPILVSDSSAVRNLALAHNGNIVNASYLRRELEEKGYSFTSSSDSEVIARLIISSPGKDLIEKLKYATSRIQGAYSLVIMTNDQLVGVRDPFGVRPLSLGSLDGGWVLASETCALDHLGAEVIREIEPGEAVLIDETGVNSLRIGKADRGGLCIFEFIYFARPDSVIGGQRLYPIRQAMGMQLAREHPVEADLVIGVPDSATAAGIGYSFASGITYSEGLLKNRYVGRTFIEPEQRLRDLGVKLKFNPMPEVLSGKRLVVVDDSIVRGTTTPQVINLLRKSGASEVHLRICAPPIRYPCFFGVDMATRRELIAAQKTVPEIAEAIGADTLGYLSIDGLIQSVGLPREKFCLACFTGDYPVPVQLEMDKLEMETVLDTG